MVKINAIESIIKVIAVMLLFFTASPIINAKKISGKIDLAIIIPASTENATHMNPFKESIKTLPNHIEMGDKKVRVAVVEPAHGGDPNTPGARILFNLSSDNMALQEWVRKWTAPTWGLDHYWHDEAFKLIRTEVFNFKDTTRSKMVIQVLNGWPYDKNNSYKEAQLLRDKGAFIYVSWPEKVWHVQREHPEAAEPEAYVGQAYPWRIVGSGPKLEDVFANALEDILKMGDEITRDLCTICKFMEQQKKCTPDLRPMGSEIDPFDDNNARCQNVKSATAIQCPESECELECTRQWPWDSDLLCTDRCVAGHHHPQQKPPLGMENCPTEFKCNWTSTCITTKASDAPAQDVSTAPPAGLTMTHLILIIAAGVVAVLIVIAIVAIILISKRSVEAKIKAEEALKRKQKQRKEAKAKFKNLAVGTVTKPVVDNMGVSLMSVMSSAKSGAKPTALRTSKLSGKSRMSSPVKKAGSMGKSQKI